MFVLVFHFVDTWHLLGVWLRQFTGFWIVSRPCCCVSNVNAVAIGKCRRHLVLCCCC